jgi:uncharacterized delta-60 repeat protein
MTLVAFAVVSSAHGAAKLDRSFNGDGFAVRAGENLAGAASVAEDSRGRLLTVGGYYEIEDSRCSEYFAARFNSDGTPDPSLGGDGLIQSHASCNYMTEVALSPNNGFVLGGGFASLALVDRFLPNGKSFPSWKDESGDSRHLLGLGYRPATGGTFTRDIALDKRGRTLVAGGAEWGLARTIGVVFRMRPDGSIDKTFKGSGRTRTKAKGVIKVQRPYDGSFDSVEEVIPLGNGRVLLGGTVLGKFMVSRLRNDGSPDLSFGRRGIVSINADRSACACSEVKAMVRDYRGRIILAGTTFERNRRHGSPVRKKLTVVRLTSDGHLDKSFGQNGVALPRDAGFKATGVAIQRDGKIVLSAEREDKFTVVRLNRMGELDRSFFGDGVYSRKPFSRLGGTASDVIVDRRGRIVAAGGISAWPPEESKLAVLRFLPR